VGVLSGVLGTTVGTVVLFLLWDELGGNSLKDDP
jgi:hypothetical protein